MIKEAEENRRDDPQGLLVHTHTHTHTHSIDIDIDIYIYIL